MILKMCANEYMYNTMFTYKDMFSKSPYMHMTNM